MSYTEEALVALDELEATLAGGCAVSEAVAAVDLVLTRRPVPCSSLVA